MKHLAFETRDRLEQTHSHPLLKMDMLLTCAATQKLFPVLRWVTLLQSEISWLNIVSVPLYTWSQSVYFQIQRIRRSTLHAGEGTPIYQAHKRKIYNIVMDFTTDFLIMQWKRNIYKIPNEIVPKGHLKMLIQFTIIAEYFSLTEYS